MSDADLSLGRPAGSGAVPVGLDRPAQRESRIIYAALALAGIFAFILVIFLMLSAPTRWSGVQSDTPFDFAYRDPHTIIKNTDRIIVDADVYVTITPHKDRPDTISIDTNTAARGANGTFTWTLTPELGKNGPTQLAGEFYYQGTLYRTCEAIIGSAINFPPVTNRLFAEQYYAINNTAARYRIPRTVDYTPFVDFMRTTIADTASFTGHGGLPSKRIRSMAGALIQSCSAP